MGKDQQDNSQHDKNDQEKQQRADHYGKQAEKTTKNN